jgi:hypothetical protein
MHAPDFSSALRQGLQEEVVVEGELINGILMTFTAQEYIAWTHRHVRPCMLLPQQ